MEILTTTIKCRFHDECILPDDAPLSPVEQTWARVTITDAINEHIADLNSIWTDASGCEELAEQSFTLDIAHTNDESAICESVEGAEHPEECFTSVIYQAYELAGDKILEHRQSAEQGMAEYMLESFAKMMRCA